MIKRSSVITFKLKCVLSSSSSLSHIVFRVLLQKGTYHISTQDSRNAWDNCLADKCDSDLQNLLKASLH